MGSFNGFGTLLYGCSDERPDKSYVAIKWITAAYVPIIPLQSMRIVEGRRGSTSVPMYYSSSLQYQIIERVPLHWRQALKTAALAWGFLLGGLVVIYFLTKR